MRGLILDTFKENKSICYLVKVTIGDYIESLPSDYREYDVQREIVKNTYLDKLIDTVLNKQHIPPIVLVVDEADLKINTDKIQIKSFKILDGLQRTYRLKLIYETVKLFEKEYQKSKTILEYSRLQISKRYKEDLDDINSNSSILFKIVKYYSNNKISTKSDFAEDTFKTPQWLEIWSNLTADEEVTKMLVLNAGHKPVKTKHQLELLFRNILPIIEKNNKRFTLIREKEVSSAKFSKDRKVGQFQFSTLITSILSLSEGKPLTSNVELIQKTQSDYFDDEIFDYYLDYSFLTLFIQVLVEIDQKLMKEFGSTGVKWMGRETSLVGMCAAVGKYKIENNLSPSQAINILDVKISGNPRVLALTAFENARNSVDLAKINIGNVNKKAVFNGLFDVLNGKANKIDWTFYFNQD